MQDKSWMTIKNRIRPEYMNGVKSFIQFAKEHKAEHNTVHCPCLQCMNLKRQTYSIVEDHMLYNGVMTSYKDWIFHGEPIPTYIHGRVESHYDTSDEHDTTRSGMTESEDEPHDELPEMLEDVYRGVFTESDCGLGSDNTDTEEVQRFDKLIKEAQCPLYSDCEKYSVLSFIIKLLHLKVMNKWSNKSFNMLMTLLKEVLPKNELVLTSLYEAKKFLRSLGLGYTTIHACKNDCVIFWKENEALTNCPECGESRYKRNDGKTQKIPHKILRYFPLIPRLQRLFMSKKTAADMRWHNEKRVNDGQFLRHLADGQEWKEFDRQHPVFAREPRNVRLGLATDGFNPFGNMSTSYSMWPIILVPYNFPPWRCMKEAFSMMSLLIPGPKAPGREIDIYMRPLIDELKDLWDNGVLTYDASNQTTFRMRAAIMWTINDFPAYGYLSGWSTQGYMACPPCNKDHSSQRLRSKIGYTGHRRFLPIDHTWRRSKMFNGKPEYRNKPFELSGEEILDQIDRITFDKFGKHPSNKKRKRSNEDLNWKKKSIFFELSYWKTLTLRHNLDVMHIEKNICDNVLGTLLSIDGKNKDTNKARMDLADMKIRKELHLIKQPDGSYIKPQAFFALSLEERRAFGEFLKSIRYPDGYASNISRCVSSKDGKVSGLKSHDCHVLLQRILPIGMRAHLSKDISTTLIELGNFFQELCCRSLRVNDLQLLQDQIVLILCKLEKIFPPAFFDVMIHLAVHLPREAMLAGPVHFRWMYPIERQLGTLKRFVGNRARPEGSIAEAYIVKECLTFCSLYLQGVETVFNRDERNRDNGDCGARLFVFSQTVRVFGRISNAASVSQKERDMAQWYVLHNSPEVEPFISEHESILMRTSSHNIIQRQQQEFPMWFQTHMRELRCQGSPIATDELWSLANGPIISLNLYSGCIHNGIRFHTSDRDKNRRTQNNGVMVQANHEGKTIDFYGYLSRVWEMTYILGYKIVLFQCEWFNLGSSRTVQNDSHYTSIDIRSRWYKEDPFVLPNQVQQVFYVNDPKMGPNWQVVQHVSHRGIWDIPELENEETDDIDSFDVDCELQQNESYVVVPIDVNGGNPMYTRSDIDPEIVMLPVSIHDDTQKAINIDDEFICDDEDVTLEEYYDDTEDELKSSNDSDVASDI